MTVAILLLMTLALALAFAFSPFVASAVIGIAGLVMVAVTGVLLLISALTDLTRE